MKTSARNKFRGKVSAIQKGPVSSEVEVGLSGGDKIYAVVTHESIDYLGLKDGSEVWAYVKAPWVMVAAGDQDMKFSARNQLWGTVTQLARGGVNSDVTITLDSGNTVSAVVTNEGIDQMGLKQGDKACAVFKAYSVILGVSG